MAENKNFTYDEELIPYRATGSMVLRLEHVLAGKPLEKMIENSQKLYDLFLGYYYDSIQETAQKLTTFEANMTLEDEEEDQNYRDIIAMCNTSSNELTFDEIEIIHKYYEISLTAIEEGKKKLEVENPKTIRHYEHFSLEDVTGDSGVLSIVKNVLKEILIKPEHIFLESRLNELYEQFDFLSDCKENRLCFAINRKLFFEYYDEILSILEKAKKFGKQIELVIDDDGTEIEKNDAKRRIPYTYTQSEMKKVGSLIRQTKAKIYFSEFFTEDFMPYRRERLWPYKEVMLANEQRHLFVERARPLDFSPFEKILVVNERITEMTYTGNATTDEKTRTIIPAEETKTRQDRAEVRRQGKGFVCTSFASYAKALVDEFGDENVECTLINVSFYDSVTKRKMSSAVHAILLVKLKDEKYGIDGYYLWDPTWDSSSCGVSHCLFPVADIENYINRCTFVDEDLNIPKAELYLFTPREENLDRQYANLKFNNKYEVLSQPIPAATFRRGLTNMFGMIKTSKEFSAMFEFMNRAETETQALVESELDDTVRSLYTFDPLRSRNDFYKRVRHYFAQHGVEFEEWTDEENWEMYLDRITGSKII